MISVSSRLMLAAIAFLSVSACASSRNLDAAFSDLSSNAKLKRGLFSDQTHEYGDIDLTIYEGRLLLTGTMHTEEGRTMLVKNAWKAENIKQVIDEVQIGDRTSIGQGIEDTRIDQTLRAKLITDGKVKSGDYKIAVSGAAVYLLGAAPGQDQLSRVLDLARGIGGVEKVVTYITVQ